MGSAGGREDRAGFRACPGTPGAGPSSFSAYGRGAHQKGFLSLMQMAKTSAATALAPATHVPIACLLLHPTPRDVWRPAFPSGRSCSLPSPSAHGFAGPARESSTHHAQSLPPGFPALASSLMITASSDVIAAPSGIRRRLSPWPPCVRMDAGRDEPVTSETHSRQFFGWKNREHGRTGVAGALAVGAHAGVCLLRLDRVQLGAGALGLARSVVFERCSTFAGPPNGKGSTAASLKSDSAPPRACNRAFHLAAPIQISERIRSTVARSRANAWASLMRLWRQPACSDYFRDLRRWLAFLAFAEAGVDVAVLETGLPAVGWCHHGSLPLACAITSIALDHQDLLGADHPARSPMKSAHRAARVPLLLGDACTRGPGRGGAGRE